MWSDFCPGNAAPTRGVNGSIAGLVYNGVSTLNSYLRRDDDFRNVAVQMGGEVTVKEKDWITIDESMSQIEFSLFVCSDRSWITSVDILTAVLQLFKLQRVWERNTKIWYSVV